MIEWAWIVPQVRNLFMACPLRSKWGEAEFNRLVLPPLALGQWCGYAEDGELKAWASWAFLSDANAEIFATKTRPIRPEDWRTGDQAWLVDVVFIPGYAFKICRETRRILSNFAPNAGYTRINQGHAGHVVRFLKGI